MPDRDRIGGAAEDPGGNVMDAAGKVTGHQLLKAEGRAERVDGKISDPLGGLKDTRATTSATSHTLVRLQKRVLSVMRPFSGAPVEMLLLLWASGK